MKPVCKCGNVIEDLNVGEDDDGNIMFSPIFCPRCEGRITTLVLKGLNYNLCIGGSQNEHKRT